MCAAFNGPQHYDPEWRQHLGLGSSFTLEAIIDRVQEQRGRRMEIVELPELGAHGDALCGLWLAMDEKDLVLHAPSASALHRQQFVLHELAHMILRHDLSDAVFTPHNLLPHVGTEGVVKALARDAIDDEFEVAAEAVADELASAIRASGRLRSKFLDVFG